MFIQLINSLKLFYDIKTKNILLFITVMQVNDHFSRESMVFLLHSNVFSVNEINADIYLELN